MRIGIPFLGKYIVPAVKRIGADMLEFAAPEVGEVISGRKSFKSAENSVGKQTLKKQFGSGSKQRRIIPAKSTKHSSPSRRDIFSQHFSLIMSNNIFGYQPFVAVSGNLGGKVANVDDILSSHEQEYYPITSLDKNCKEFEFQTDREYYVDLTQSFFELELKFVKERVYDTY